MTLSAATPMTISSAAMYIHPRTNAPTSVHHRLRSMGPRPS
jgi:hypothetical protein